MKEDNPFEVTSESLEGGSGPDCDPSTAEVSSRTIQLLNETCPWVRLIGILLWIGTVFLGIACFFMLIGGLISQDLTFVGLSIVYILLTGVYWIFARSLTTYASKIDELRSSGKVSSLEDALEAQRTFWKTAGIIAVVVLIMYAVLIVLMVSGAFMISTGIHQ